MIIRYLDPTNGLGLRVCGPGVSGLRCSFQAPRVARREGELEITTQVYL